MSPALQKQQIARAIGLIHQLKHSFTLFGDIDEITSLCSSISSRVNLGLPATRSKWMACPGTLRVSTSMSAMLMSAEEKEVADLFLRPSACLSIWIENCGLSCACSLKITNRFTNQSNTGRRVSLLSCTAIDRNSEFGRQRLPIDSWAFLTRAEVINILARVAVKVARKPALWLERLIDQQVPATMRCAVMAKPYW